LNSVPDVNFQTRNGRDFIYHVVGFITVFLWNQFISPLSLTANYGKVYSIQHFVMNFVMSMVLSVYSGVH